MASDRPQNHDDSVSETSDETTPPTARSDAKPARQEGSVKETIESILVAFILAFVFRAFIVEAFVIPTGSMAPTLLGAHMRYRCADCGWRWTVNYSTGVSQEDIDILSTYSVRSSTGGWAVADVPVPLHCPNCGFAVRREDKVEPENTLAGPPVFYGDRILVLKYLYLFQEPERWDVVVFKNPDGGQMPTATEPHYSQNYIKRLVGKPGESIMILDGDVYVGPPNADPRENPAAFKVQRKPWNVQESLWRNVYHNDYIPHLDDANRRRSSDARFRNEYINQPVGALWKQPWTPTEGAGWNLGASGRSRTFEFAGLQQSGALKFDPEANPDTKAFLDHIAYDEIDEIHKPFQTAWKGNPVSDLKVDLFYERLEGEGAFDVELTHRSGHVFTARITSGQVSLLKSIAGGPQEVVRPAIAAPDLNPGKAAHIQFCHIDYTIVLRINGNQVLTFGDKPEDNYGPDVAKLIAERSQTAPLPGVRLIADKQRARVEHLRLDRDIHYLNQHSWPGQQSLWGDPDRPIDLGKDEYFVLGDNSFISGDARVWSRDINLPDEHLQVQAGRVPKRFLLGKAFFVYWPAGFRPFRGAPGLVPNFGEMRMIQ